VEGAALASKDDAADPVIEEPPGGDGSGDISGRALRQRVRQQEILAELGVAALKGTPFLELLELTARLAAEGLQAEFSKVMEYLPAEQRLLIRAGLGWPREIIGVARVGADLASPAGYALRTGQPVISNHLENEERFRTPELLVQHGIRRAMNVILQGDGTPYGVLEVDSRSEGEFGEQDIAFMQGAANLLGMAIERQRIESSLRTAVQQQELLLQELDHRVSNSLQLVMSMLHLQAGGTDDGNVRQHLQEASSRIAAIARAHRRLQSRGQSGLIELGGYLGEVCDDLSASLGMCRFEDRLAGPAAVPTNRAVSIAIVLTELVTNAAKHAYPEGVTGTILVRLEPLGAGGYRLTVVDEGAGLPAGFVPSSGKGLGMRIALALTQQLGGSLDLRGTPGRGTEVELALPPATHPNS
jgi:two-component sensor histidine kinase